MHHRSTLAAWLDSLYLLVYVLFLNSGRVALRMIAEVMLLFSPLLLVWMVYSVIRYGKFTGKELEEGEEFGYSDKPKDTLGIF